VHAECEGFNFYMAEKFVDILYDNRLYGNINMYTEKKYISETTWILSAELRQ